MCRPSSGEFVHENDIMPFIGGISLVISLWEYGSMCDQQLNCDNGFSNILYCLLFAVKKFYVFADYFVIAKFLAKFCDNIFKCDVKLITAKVV